MGWAHCGTDDRGRPIGYAVAARCDARFCFRRIDRGLSYVCGKMHGGENGCGGYFCSRHLTYGDDELEPKKAVQMCHGCVAEQEQRRRAARRAKR